MLHFVPPLVPVPAGPGNRVRMLTSELRLIKGIQEASLSVSLMLTGAAFLNFFFGPYYRHKHSGGGMNAHG